MRLKRLILCKKQKQKAEDFFEQTFDSLKQIKKRIYSEITDAKEVLNKGESLLRSVRNKQKHKPVEKLQHVEQLLKDYRAEQIQAREKAQSFSAYLDKLNLNQQEWEECYNELPFYVRWLNDFVNSFDKQTISHNKLFFNNLKLSPKENDLDSKRSVINYFSDQINSTFSQKKKKETKVSNLDSTIKKLEQLKDWYLTKTNVKKLEGLDKTIRFKMFKLATHYWEVRWLLEAKKYLNEEKKYSREATEQEWKRYAMLTPCFVSTFYMAPKFFDYWKPGTDGEYPPLDNFADLLIVDEAGQVPTEVGAATFSLAKKALVVGDIYQIQPVWSINRTVDFQNFHAVFRDNNFSYDVFQKSGKNANGSSIMRVAQKRSPYQIDDYKVGGMLLTEHWRCVPKIIGYCNELVYDNKLTPKIEPRQTHHLPRFGYAHIAGQSKRDNKGSRYNEEEARAIRQWIIEHRDELINESNEANLKDIVAIVTPFRSQADDIQEQLDSKGLGQITIGTVHALQGAERDIVIFSSVYSQQNSSSYFFDQDVTMLNVAVSRAKKSFLVFGNMQIFNSEKDIPSGVLAEKLFENRQNELTNIDVPKLLEETKGSSELIIEKVANLKRHRGLLAYCFREAQKRIIIASPYISAYAVESDNMQQMVIGAVKRGVKVTCFIDAKLNQTQSNGIKPSARQAIRVLKEAGAIVRKANNFHNKTLCADKFLISEGSFNWLSAQRKKTDKYQRYERSFVYLSKDNTPNETISDLIQDFTEDMDTLI